MTALFAGGAVMVWQGGLIAGPAATEDASESGSAAAANTAIEILDDKPIPQALLRPMKRWQERYIAQLLSPLRRYAGPDQTLDQSDIDRVRKKAEVDRRVRELTEFLRYDLNGDGAVSRDEIESPLLKHRGRWDSEKIKSIDLDGDERITFEEARKALEGLAAKKRRRSGNAETLVALLELDPNGDGRLTAEELKALGEAAFAKFDKDGDGTLSAEEDKARKEYVANPYTTHRRKYARRVPQAPINVRDCPLPPAGKNVRVVVIGADQADTIPTVTVVGQDEETETSSLRIEDGEADLYLIATSDVPNIWRVTGKTDRVARFVTFPQKSYGAHPGVGVTGLAEARVTFLPAGSCFGDFHKADSDVGREAKAKVEAALGRPVYNVIAKYKFRHVAVPSGKDLVEDRAQTGGIFYRDEGGKGIFVSKEEIIRLRKEERLELEREFANRKPPPNIKPETFRQFNKHWLRDEIEKLQRPAGIDVFTYSEFKRFYPGGVVMIDAEKVVAPGNVAEYTILPNQAGLIQLMKEGRIKRMPGRFYYIQKPIPRFPTGLAGAHSVTFVLAKGIPMPKGSPGHSCVLSEGKREQLAGPPGIHCFLR